MIVEQSVSVDAGGATNNNSIDALASIEVQMPKGPQGQKRPADSIGCAVMVGKIATGEVCESLKGPTGKVKSGIAGAKARSENLTSEERSAIAKKAAETRWR